MVLYLIVKLIHMINRTAKVDLDEHIFYVLDEAAKCWKEIPSLYTDYCYGNIMCSEIEFNDEYPIEEKKD